MKQFDAWIKAGKPEKRDDVSEETAAETVETVEEMQNEDEFDITSTATSNFPSEFNLPFASTPAVHQPQPVQPDSTSFIQPSDILVIPPLPYRAPPGFRWRCKLELERINEEVVPPATTTNGSCGINS